MYKRQVISHVRSRGFKRRLREEKAFHIGQQRLQTPRLIALRNRAYIRQRDMIAVFGPFCSSVSGLFVFVIPSSEQYPSPLKAALSWYNDFENEAKREEIVAFAQTEEIDPAMLTDCAIHLRNRGIYNLPFTKYNLAALSSA